MWKLATALKAHLCSGCHLGHRPCGMVAALAGRGVCRGRDQPHGKKEGEGGLMVKE